MRVVLGRKSGGVKLNVREIFDFCAEIICHCNAVAGGNRGIGCIFEYSAYSACAENDIRCEYRLDFALCAHDSQPEATAAVLLQRAEQRIFQ